VYVASSFIAPGLVWFALSGMPMLVMSSMTLRHMVVALALMVILWGFPLPCLHNLDPAVLICLDPAVLICGRGSVRWEDVRAFILGDMVLLVSG
jgi:hypothetical protein